jgi:hypothetical protein
MNRRLFLAVVALSLAFFRPLLPAPALAADAPSPEAILKAIYGAYGPNASPEDPQGKYFTPDLLAKYNAAVTAGGDDPETGLGFDIFLDADEAATVSGLKLTAGQTSATAAAVDAQFKVLDEERDIRFDFVKTASGWKIDDLDWGDDEGTLRMFLDQLMSDDPGLDDPGLDDPGADDSGSGDPGTDATE